jgi:hypothetical protein
MTKLPAIFTRREWKFEQLVRKGDFAVFRKSKVTVSGVLCASFEVVIVQHVPEMVVFGQKVPAHEKYPASEQWGTRGWTFTDQDSAFTRLAELKAKK